MGTTYGTTGIASTQGTTGTTAGREMGVGQEQQFSEQAAAQHGKPSMMDKIIGMLWWFNIQVRRLLIRYLSGGTEKGFGKITSNPAMVQQGAERAVRVTHL